MFKNANEIRKVIYAESSKEIKNVFWRQNWAGAFNLIATLYFVNEAVNELIHLFRASLI